MRGGLMSAPSEGFRWKLRGQEFWEGLVGQVSGPNFWAKFSGPSCWAKFAGKDPSANATATFHHGLFRRHLPVVLRRQAPAGGGDARAGHARARPTRMASPRG